MFTLGGAPCPYCTRKMYSSRDKHGRLGDSHPTRDHILPQHLGGRFWIWVCHKCNADKAELTIAAWLGFLDRAGDKRAAIVRAYFEANPRLKRFMYPPAVHPSDERARPGVIYSTAPAE